MKSTPPRVAQVKARFGLIATLTATVLAAQSTTTPAGSTEPKKEEPQQIERFVVTGSYIPSTETSSDTGASPVTKIDRQIIESSGYTNTAELLQQITASNANSVPISNNATGFTPGASAISLRGLGPEATLVLINGRRVASYPVGVGGTTAFVDLNSIPLSAIDSIEVLKDGASALYGADAVAGVINIKLRRGLDGTETFASYGNTIDKDSAEVVANLATGVTTAKLSVLVSANYYRKAAIMNRDRRYSATPPFLSTNSSPANLDLSRFAIADALGQSVNAPIPGVPNNALLIYGQSGAVPANDGRRPASQYTYSLDRTATYNFNETAMSYPESERKGGIAFAERKLFGTDNIRGYVDLSYQDVFVENQLAPTATGDFNSAGSTELIVPARTTNPVLTVAVPQLGGVFGVVSGTPVPAGSIPGPGTQIINGAAQRLAPAGASNPFNPFNQDIADGTRTRLAEFGNRIIQNETDAFMFSTGIKGENVAGRWNFDATFNYSSIGSDTRSRLTSASRFNEMVNANSPIFDPRSPSYVGTTVPYNPFGFYRNPIAGNLALSDYARVDIHHVDKSTLSQVSFVASTAELWKLPAGSVGLALGGDFRRERLDQDSDSFSTSGDVIGESPRAVTVAQRKIGGVFAEGRLPIYRGVEGSASVRHEKFFSSRRDTTVPKFGLRVRPFGHQLTLRTSYSKGFREPSLYELYSSPISAQLTLQDPRNGVVEPEQPITLRGNRNLRPEKTDYFNAGFVWSPTIRRFKGLSLGADWWEITRKGTVEANPQYTLARAFGAVPGGMLPGESVSFTNLGVISSVNSVFFNVGRTEVSGWDFSGGYQLPTDRLGRWELTTVWTMIRRFYRSSVEGAPLVSVLGQDSTGFAENGYLKWKGFVRLNWMFKGFAVQASGSYTDGFEDEDLNGDPFQIADSFIVDGQVSYSFRRNYGRWLRDTKFTLGARNLFDRDPPLALGGGGNGEGYPSHLYTAENMFWYTSVSRKF